MSAEHHISSLEEMILFGENFGKTCEKNQVISLSGDLGAGKTTLAKGIISGLCGVPVGDITSPTFQYVHYYEGNGFFIAHYDLWRLKGVDEFLALGLDEYLTQKIMCLIEWSDRIEFLLPPSTIFVESKVSGHGRDVQIRRGKR
jgi:tRNA threonylcarbamoyladenosine biosynthesis protein TsaE